MEKEIYFHVGLAKTGSTFLQKNVFTYLKNIKYISTHDYVNCIDVINKTNYKSYLISREFDKQFESEIKKFISNIKDNNKEYNERDILYKVLFDVKNDVTELKKLINKILTDRKINIDVSKEQKKLLDNYSIKKEDSEVSSNTNIKNTKNNQFHEVTEVFNNDSLSLEKNEKEFIIRALKKNHNKRKYAAKDLGISERTLYRKIKQYNLEKF